MELLPFLSLYTEHLRPAFLAADFRHRIGKDAVEALLRAEILRDRPIAARYPCGRAIEHPQVCSRRVVKDASRPGIYRAYCGNRRTSSCPTLILKAEDLEEYYASHDGLGRFLRARLALDGAFRDLGPAYADSLQLGEFGHGGERYEVFLSIGGSLGKLLDLCTSSRCRSIVLSPTSDRIPLEWVHRHIPGGKVVLAYLVDMLGLQGGEIVVRTGLAELLYDEPAELPPFCRAYTWEGNSTPNHLEYRRIVGTAPALDFFLDGTGAASPDGSYFASCRIPAADGGTVYKTLRIPPRKAMVLIELVANRGNPLRPTDMEALRDMTHASANRIVQLARQLIDVQTGPDGTSDWLWIQTIRGGRRGVRYVFSPKTRNFVVLAALSGR